MPSVSFLAWPPHVMDALRSNSDELVPPSLWLPPHTPLAGTTRPAPQIAPRTRLIQLTLGSGATDSPCAAAAVIAHQPGNRRFDAPPLPQECLPGWSHVERGTCPQMLLVGRQIHRPVAGRLGRRGAALLPQRAALTLRDRSADDRVRSDDERRCMPRRRQPGRSAALDVSTSECARVLACAVPALEDHG